jgi:hypothetical protein
MRFVFFFISVAAERKAFGRLHMTDGKFPRFKYIQRGTTFDQGLDSSFLLGSCHKRPRHFRVLFRKSFPVRRDLIIHKSTVHRYRQILCILKRRLLLRSICCTQNSFRKIIHKHFQEIQEISVLKTSLGYFYLRVE